MNERVIAHWEEATGSVWPRPYKFTAGEYDIHLKKFAELIVKECAHIAEVNQAENMGWNIGEIIKEHFGVEE